MPDKKMLEVFRTRFRNYADSFPAEKPLLMKKEHCFKVSTEMADIARSLELPENDVILAETMGLFHDIGRFRQYAEYRTFVDRRSEDHAELSIKVILENDLVEELDEAEKELVTSSISFHNKMLLPDGLPEKHSLFARALRDADKLDILRFATEYYRQIEEDRDKAVELDLPDTPGFSADICEDVTERRTVKMTDLRNLNDFKLMQAGWTYDINFSYSLETIEKRNFLEKLRESLPRDDTIDRMFSSIRDFLKTPNADIQNF